MSKYETITEKIIDNVAIVTLNREEVHNAFNNTMIEELTTEFKYLGNDPGIKVIVLTGTGKSFSSGADLNYMQESKDFTYEENFEDAFRLEQLFYTLFTTPKPVIGRINGAAFGGAIGLISTCDFCIAISSAKMAFSEVKIGIMPAVISPYVVPKIGYSHAKRLFLTGEKFDARKAYEIGLVHEVVNDIQELDRKVTEIINQFLTSSPAAIVGIKQLLTKNRDTDFQTLRKYCIDQIAEIRTSSQGKEGISAFLEKRSPSWNVSTWKGNISEENTN